MTIKTFEQWAAQHPPIQRNDGRTETDPVNTADTWDTYRDLPVLQQQMETWWSEYQGILAAVDQRGSVLASESRDTDRLEAAIRAANETIRNNTIQAPQWVAEERDGFGQEDNPMTVTDTDPRVWARDDSPQGSAFRSWVRQGPHAEPELRAQGVATGAAGGFLVPPAFRAKLIEALKAYSAVRAVAEPVPTDSGQDLPFPVNNDTGNVGAILAENTQVAEQDVTISQATLHAFMYVSKMVRVSLQLIQDSGYDIDSFLARKLAERIGRIQNTHFTVGTGTTQPVGIQPTATVGVTSAAVAAVTTDELIDLVHSVDSAYREGPGFVGWMMNDLTFAKIRKLKDGDGNYLVEPDVKAGLPNSLLGHPLKINPDMPVMATGVKSILFGNFTAGYAVRDVKSVEVARLVERYMDYLQVGFLGYQRADGIIQDSIAYKALQNA